MGKFPQFSAHQFQEVNIELKSSRLLIDQVSRIFLSYSPYLSNQNIFTWDITVKVAPHLHTFSPFLIKTLNIYIIFMMVKPPTTIRYNRVVYEIIYNEIQLIYSIVEKNTPFPFPIAWIMISEKKEKAVSKEKKWTRLRWITRMEIFHRTMISSCTKWAQI